MFVSDSAKKYDSVDPSVIKYFAFLFILHLAYIVICCHVFKASVSFFDPSADSITVPTPLSSPVGTIIT